MTCVEEGVKVEQAHVHNWVSWERGGEGRGEWEVMCVVEGVTEE